MIKTVYICDHCGEEKTQDTLFCLSPWAIEGDTPEEITQLVSGRHICPECLADLFAGRAIEKARKEAAKPAPKKPQPKESIDMDEYRKRQAKKSYMTKADEAKVTELYRKGMEMEDIAEELRIYISVISHYIADTGLGEERYGKKAVG